MTKHPPYLHDTLAFYDAVQLTVLASEAPQSQSAMLLKLYTTRHGMSRYEAGQRISFVYGPTTWGNTPLAVGETAIVFLNATGKGLYEKPFHGHYVIEDMAGEPRVIVLDLKTDGCEDKIIVQSLPHTHRPNARVISLAALEQYIRSINQW